MRRKRKTDLNIEKDWVQTSKKRTSLYDNFQQGDLVFGLNSSTASIYETLENRGYHHYYCNSLNGAVVSSVFENKPEPSSLDVEQKKHYHFLSKHKAYLQREGGKPIPVMEDEPALGAAFRRACKLLLVNRDPERNYTAHVVLKDVDWNRVCDKTDKGITNSEIRAAYRDEQLHGKHPHILFYNKKLVPYKRSPWNLDNNQEIFDEYDRQRENKPRAV